MIIEDCTIFLFKRKTFVIYVKIQVWEWIGNHWSRWKRGWNSVGERRGAYKGRENFSVRHRSVGMAARLVRGNTRNKFRNLTAIPPGARTFEFSCGARDGKLLPLLLALFQHLSRRPLLSALAGISKNSLFNGEREISFLEYYQSFPKFSPSIAIVRGMRPNNKAENIDESRLFFSK